MRGIIMTLFSITSKASGWKAVISALKNSSEEAQFQITNEGIRFYGAPPGNAFIISMMWKAENLNELTLDAEKTVPFRTDDIEKIFRRFASDDIVTISQKQEGFITIESGKRSWDLRVLHESSAIEPRERQWGLEKTPEEFLGKMKTLMDNLYRVLKETGTCWINIGDTYSTGNSGMPQGINSKDYDTGKNNDRYGPIQNLPNPLLCDINQKLN